MEILELRPGTPIEFSFASTNSDVESNIDEDRSIYISSVFGVTKKEEIIFHIPTRKGHTVTIPMNVPFNAVFNTKHVPDSKLKKVQRRDYFRFQCLIPVKVLPIPKDVAILPNMALVEDDLEKYGNTYGPPVTGNILDISGGGAKFSAKTDILTERYMYVSFKLKSKDMDETINVIARRVKTEHKENLGVYEHRIEFLFKEPEDRETIIKYIFDEDRRLRKKDQG